MLLQWKNICVCFRFRNYDASECILLIVALWAGISGSVPNGRIDTDSNSFFSDFEYLLLQMKILVRMENILLGDHFARRDAGKLCSKCCIIETFAIVRGCFCLAGFTRNKDVKCIPIDCDDCERDRLRTRQCPKCESELWV